MNMQEILPGEHIRLLTKLLVSWFYEQTITYDRALATFLTKTENKSA